MRDITMETFSAVLFDNDGTLIDSSGAVTRSWQAWARHHGVSRERFGNLHGVPSRGIVAAVAPHLDQDLATADIDRRELEDLDGVVALPGAVAALAAVPGLAAIVTSAGRRLAELRLGAAGVQIPGVLVSADDITRGKPDPEPYLIGAARMGVDPARCLVVEDAPAGLRSGRAAGAATLGLLTTSRHEELVDHADAVVADLSRVRFVQVDDGVRAMLQT